MIEKRYKSYKYVHCYCIKDEDVLIGIKIYRYVNIFVILPICLVLSSMVIAGAATVAISMKIAIVAGIISIPLLLSLFAYTRAKKVMLKAGHTKYCSNKIGYLAILYDGTWSEFKIMKEKID